MNFYKDKRVFVAGGTGLIGRPLVKRLLNKGAKVRVASLDDISLANPETEFYQCDLTDYKNCRDVCSGMDYVFNLLCVKGSPLSNKERPASFLDKMLLFNTNLLRAAREEKVAEFLFTSTYGVYHQAEIFDDKIDVLKTPLPENDFFSGLAKRVGEAQARAYGIEHGWKNIAIVRPSNTYGPYDNFAPENSMVIPSLIRKAVEGENPLIVWGDGNNTRDFVHADDVARGMLIILENNPGPECPVNLGSGKKYNVREALKIILDNVESKPEAIWESSLSCGDKSRVVDISRAKSFGFESKISLEEGIKETIEWYKNNKEKAEKRYDALEIRK